MTPRLQAARAEVARLLDRYMRPYSSGRRQLEVAVAELEAAARVEDDKPSDPPVTYVTLPGTENNPDGGTPFPAAELPALDLDPAHGQPISGKPTKPSGKHKKQ